MRITDTENKFLDSLVQDSITYRLTTCEALTYIENRFKKISEASYKHRKARVLSEESTKLWLNYFTRIGFIHHHKQQIDTIQLIQRDSIEQLYIETQRSIRDEAKILNLKHNIKENVKLLSELGIGTPIISAIKSKMQQAFSMERTHQSSNAD